MAVLEGCDLTKTYDEGLHVVPAACVGGSATVLTRLGQMSVTTHHSRWAAVIFPSQAERPRSAGSELEVILREAIQPQSAPIEGILGILRGEGSDRLYVA